MKIPEYKDLTEKGKVFGSNYQQITTIDDLKEFLESVKSFKKCIYRGICEAKYKNFTSAQRKYIINDYKSNNINDLIQKQIESVRREHKCLLGKYYKSLDISPNDFLYLGIAQHYGGISPLLDFTTDFKTALFFMTDGVVLPLQGVDDIGNYSSLYYVPNDNLSDFNYVIKRVVKKVSNRIKELGIKVRKDDIIELLADFDIFKDISIDGDFNLLIPNKKVKLVVPIKGKNEKLSVIFSISNLNIVAQKGCFVFYLPTNSSLPFEAPLHCIDIHKSLIPYIIEYANLKKSDIYPDEYELVKDSCYKAIRNILNK